MKAPGSYLLTWFVILLGGAIYLAIGIHKYTTGYQILTGVVVAAMAVVAVLLILRYRWSPEVFATLFTGLVVVGVVWGLRDGFGRNEIGVTMGALLALTAYPTLRKEIREAQPPTGTRSESA